MNSPILACHHLKKEFHTGLRTMPVLRDVSFEIARGEITYVTGRSGSGKTTLLHLLGGLDVPTSGTILYNDKKVKCGNERFVTEYRNRHVGFVFQFFHLLPELSVLENVILPGLIGRRKKKEIRAYGMELLSIMGLEDRATHLPRGLSGGEMQRIALARALLNSPDIVLCDEPTGNLDEDNAKILYNLINKINQVKGTTFCIVTHDEKYVAGEPRVFRLQGGTVRSETWD